MRNVGPDSKSSSTVAVTAEDGEEAVEAEVEEGLAGEGVVVVAFAVVEEVADDVGVLAAFLLEGFEVLAEESGWPNTAPEENISATEAAAAAFFRKRMWEWESIVIIFMGIVKDQEQSRKKRCIAL